jgi:transcriptional regulator with XRE-family HTH domain
MQSKPRRDLADEMNRRRAQLRLTWDQVAARAGISIATLRRLRNGDDPVSLDTMIGIDSALEWAPGYVEARLKGARPPSGTKSPEVGQPPEKERQRLIREMRELRDRHLEEAARAEVALARLEGRDTEAAG